MMLKKPLFLKINDVCDYVIARMVEAGGNDFSLLKLQKLLYYIQAWHLALHKKALFKGRFQAWVHGPVSREIYDRFAGSKMLYSSLVESDIRRDFDVDNLPRSARKHIDEVLSVYGAYSGTQLESLTHREKPWLDARGNLKPNERCEEELDEEVMSSFYAARAAKKK